MMTVLALKRPNKFYSCEGSARDISLKLCLLLINIYDVSGERAFPVLSGMQLRYRLVMLWLHVK